MPYTLGGRQSFSSGGVDVVPAVSADLDKFMRMGNHRPLLHKSFCVPSGDGSSMSSRLGGCIMNNFVEA